MDQNNVLLFPHVVNTLIGTQPSFHDSLYSLKAIVSVIVGMCVALWLRVFERIMITYSQVQHGVQGKRGMSREEGFPVERERERLSLFSIP